MEDRSITDEDILLKIVDAFAQSHDFNGISLIDLAASLNLDLKVVLERLKPLLEDGKVSLSFEGHTGNPHIKRLRDLPIEVQISRMGTEEASGVCVYPSQMLASTRLGSRFDDRPYSKRLALAEAQLIPVFFELQVLERYFRDPRYACWFGDSAGTISIGDNAYFSDETSEKDKISVQSFGIGYDSARRRVVAVFLRYLSDLSPEHQHYWRTFEVSGICTMNSDYERVSIRGDWPEYRSAYEAFIQEQVEINKLCGLLGKPHLFRETYEGRHRPIQFSSMLRPTRSCFDEFVHLLDKMLSDNFDKGFFKGDIPLEEHITRADGTVEVRQFGSIALLEHWLKRHYRNRDGKDVSKEVVAPFKEIRMARQPVAHSIGQNEYDLSLPSKQDDLLGLVKNGLARLRWILSSHPDATPYEAQEWLDGNKIVFY
jgi:hypothetical protein